MIKSYIKNEKIISYEIIYKPIKHVYFRKTQTHILISANNKMSEKSILNILDINFDKIYKLQTKSPRLKTNKFQLWGENVTKESYFDNLSPTEDNYKKILIN